MSFDDPDNSALDALFNRAATHAEARPAFFQALLDYELYTLIGRGRGTRPAEEVQRPAPERALPLIQWENANMPCFFVFTNAAHARKAQRTFSSMAPEPLIIIGKPGLALLQSMNRARTGICFNPGASAHELVINDAILTNILDGTLFEPAAPGSGERERGSVRPLPAEEYPLALVQPAFDHLKTRPEVMAAWVLAPHAQWARGERLYVFALLTTAEDTAALCHSVDIVLSMVDSTERTGMEFAVTTLDYGDPSHASLMRAHPPFYAAPDYHPAA